MHHRRREQGHAEREQRPDVAQRGQLRKRPKCPERRKEKAQPRDRPPARVGGEQENRPTDRVELALDDSVQAARDEGDGGNQRENFPKIGRASCRERVCLAV